MHYFLGIDPGSRGAVAVINNLGDICTVMPFEKSKGAETLTARDIFLTIVYQVDVFRSERISHVVLERVSGRGGGKATWGATNTFNFGRNCGWIEMALVALDLDYSMVAPQVWMREMHKGIFHKIPKERSARAVQKLYPEYNFFASARSRKPHDGMIDALLMAEYCRRKFK